MPTHPRFYTSQAGHRNSEGDFVAFPAACDALGAMGVLGSVFHTDFVDNVYHKTMVKTPQAAVVQATYTPFRGSGAGTECAFHLDGDTDLLYGATLMGVLPGLFANVDATNQSRTPIVDDFYFPLKMEDAEAIAQVGGTAQGYLATYYGANADTVIVNATTACSSATQQLEFVGYSVEAGLYLFRENYIKAGSCVLDRNMAQYIAAENALNGTIDQDFTEMWGGAASLADSVLKSMFTRYVYVILPFFFSRNIGSCLSIISSVFSKPEISTQVAKADEVTFRSASNVTVKVGATGLDLKNADIHVALDCRFILLENMLRDAFASADFENVILVTDTDILHKGTQVSQQKEELNAKGYALGFVIMVQRVAAQLKNMWSYYAGIDGRDALLNLNVNVNSTCLMNMEAIRARTVNPAFATPSIPKIPVYLFAFTVNLYSDTILMGRNLQLVNNVSLHLTWQAGLETEECVIYVFTVQATLLKYRKQHASLMFK